MHSGDAIDDQQGGGEDDVVMQTGGGASGEADKLFAKVMEDCGDTLTEFMHDDRQKVAALAATCVGASVASKSWRLLVPRRTPGVGREVLVHFRRGRRRGILVRPRRAGLRDPRPLSNITTH